MTGDDATPAAGNWGIETAGAGRRQPLPIDAYIPALRAHLERHRAVILTAAPGAGKTTRVPPALAEVARTIVLQPRRMAARAVARRIAEERGWTPGLEVGWHVRFDRRFGPETRLLVVTEGILTARLQQDPLLSGFGVVVFDEFHERSIHGDLGLALARQAWLARDDLRIVVMSATLDGAQAASFLGGCPVVDVPGARHPLTIEYAAHERLADAVRGVLPRTAGHVLCFLPGAREIARAAADLGGRLAGGIGILPLHGTLDAAAQDAVLRESPVRRVILATNIAETSLTVPGVSAVVDGGLVKVARYDAIRGIDSLVTERVPQDSADQRAGRAARLGPGLVRRLWDVHDRLRPHREPEIRRIDLAGPLLQLIAWGGDPRAFEWLEAPPAARVDAAVALLERLGAVETIAGVPRATALGHRLQRIPLHPRLARILWDGGGSREAAAICALLADGDTPSNADVATACDLLPALDRFDEQPGHVRQVAHELHRAADRAFARTDGPAAVGERALRHAIFTGYADRLAKRRPGTRDRFTLASGHGASLGRESGVRDAEYLVALDVVDAGRDGIREAIIRTASRVEREWIVPTATAIAHRLDAGDGRVRAARLSRYMGFTLAETPAPVDPQEAASLLGDAWLSRPRDERSARLLSRLRFAGLEVDLAALVRQAAQAVTALDDIDLAAHLPYDVARRLAVHAPETFVVPSGRASALTYAGDGTVSIAVKLQEVFGLADTPRLGPAQVPLTFHLLAPNGRVVQTTRDLRSFWTRTYPEVRKALRGRYPRHPWPDDPWTASPTHRTVRRR